MDAQVVNVIDSMLLFKREHLGEGKEIVAKKRTLASELITKHEHVIRANQTVSIVIK